MEQHINSQVTLQAGQKNSDGYDSSPEITEETNQRKVSFQPGTKNVNQRYTGLPKLNAQEQTHL